MLSTVLLLVAQATFTPSQSQPAIVITGRRIEDAQANLRACLARKCPVDEDIDATLALAETQIIAGEYRDASSTIAKSLRRNKDEAKRYPVPVSDLYRASSKVSAHLGFDKNYYRSTWGIHKTLKEGLPESEDRKFSSLMEVAEMVYRTRGHERARLYYDSIAKQARKAGRPDIAAMAELRSAIRHLPPGSSWQMNEIRRVADLPGEEMEAPVLEAKLALARMALEKNDERGAQKAMRALAHLNIKRPILIYAPAFDVRNGQLGSGEMGALGTRTFGASFATGGDTPSQGDVSSKSSGAHVPSGYRMGLDVEDEWIDVGFRITPDGRVADLKVLRSRGDNVWAPPLLSSIQGRRYTPGKDNDPASTRRERYTYTSGMEMGAGRRMATHSPKGRIEYLDLSPSGIASPDS